MVNGFFDGGAWQFQGYTIKTDCSELCMEDSLVYTKVLCSAAEIACKGQDFYLGMTVDT